jgi:ankyrin repeat protein
MSVLLKHHKALVTQKINEYGATPAHYASEQNNPEILEELYKVSPVITRVPAGPPELTPLHTAAKLGSLRAAEWLLKHDTTVCNLPDNSGYTALHFAVIDGNKDMVNLLIANGANLSLSTKPGATHAQKTPLQLATEHANNEITQLLMKHGATADKDHPIDTSKLNELLRIAFALHEYINDRGTKPEFLNSVFGYNPIAWPKKTKIEMAQKVYDNIINGLPPLSDLDPDKLGALKDRDLGIIAKPLFTGKQSPRVSPTPSPNASLSPSPTH